MTKPNQLGRPSIWAGAFKTALVAFGLSAAIPATSHADRSFETWINKYDPTTTDSSTTGSPRVYSVAVDRFGSVAIGGYNYVGNTLYYVAKYDNLGALLWEKELDAGGGSAVVRSVTMDSNGNVIVTGGAYFNDTTKEDIYTIKYSASTGSELWHVQYDGPNHGQDYGIKVITDSSDNVIITGRSIGVGTNEDIYTAKYTSGGSFVWEMRYNSPTNHPDYPVGLTHDSQNNIIVAGLADEGGDTKTLTIRYAAANGAVTLLRTFQGVSGTSYYGARGVIVDKDDNIITTGLVRTQSGGSHFLRTIKYDNNNAVVNPVWIKTFQDPVAFTTDSTNDPDSVSLASVVTDSAGNIIVTGTSDVSGNTVIQSVKYAAADGAIQWHHETPAPGGSDLFGGAGIDFLDNLIIAGTSTSENNDQDFYTTKLSPNGDTIFERRFDDGNDGGTDLVKRVAVGPNGNFAVTGECKKSTGAFNEIITIYHSHTFLAVGDDVTANGIPDNAKIASLFPPVISDSGTVAAKVTLAAGKKRLAALLSVGTSSGLQVPAYQGGPAAGISGATFTSFSDPILSPNGRIAFIGKVTGGGVKASESTGVWTDAVNGVMQNILRVGQPVNAIQGSPLLQSISSISIRDNQLVALIKLKGSGITKANSTALCGFVPFIGNSILPAKILQTGDPFTVNGPNTDSTIKAITLFTPAKGSTGDGRTHGDNNIIARITLADKSSVILTSTTLGGITQRLYSGGDASGVLGSGVQWKSFGLPALNTGGTKYTTLAGLSGTGVTTANDTAIVYYNGSTLGKIAREDDDASGVQGAKYASFLDPVVSPTGLVSFIGTMKGNVSGKNKTALWYGIPGILIRLAQTGKPAPDPAGFDTDANFTSFTSLGFPGGGCGPLFLAKVTGKNNTGLWAYGTVGGVRQILRVGDQFGTTFVKKFSVLQPTSGSVGVTRSFNSNRAVVALISFSDKTVGVVEIGIP